jgi:hypothetical protein
MVGGRTRPAPCLPPPPAIQACDRRGQRVASDGVRRDRSLSSAIESPSLHKLRRPAACVLVFGFSGGAIESCNHRRCHPHDYWCDRLALRGLQLYQTRKDSRRRADRGDNGAARDDCGPADSWRPRRGRRACAPLCRRTSEGKLRASNSPQLATSGASCGLLNTRRLHVTELRQSSWGRSTSTGIGKSNVLRQRRGPGRARMRKSEGGQKKNRSRIGRKADPSSRPADRQIRSASSRTGAAAACSSNSTRNFTVGSAGKPSAAPASPNAGPRALCRNDVTASPASAAMRTPGTLEPTHATPNAVHRAR